MENYGRRLKTLKELAEKEHREKPGEGQTAETTARRREDLGHSKRKRAPFCAVDKHANEHRLRVRNRHSHTKCQELSTCTSAPPENTSIKRRCTTDIFR